MKISLHKLHGKAFNMDNNMDNIQRFFFCFKACKLTIHLIMSEITFFNLLPIKLVKMFMNGTTTDAGFKAKEEIRNEFQKC